MLKLQWPQTRHVYTLRDMSKDLESRGAVASDLQERHWKPICLANYMASRDFFTRVLHGYKDRSVTWRHCRRTSILSGCLPLGLSQAECIKLAEPSTSRTCGRLLAQRALLPGSFGAATCHKKEQTMIFGTRNGLPFLSWPSPGFGRPEIFLEQARMAGIFLCTFIRRPFAAVGSAWNSECSPVGLVERARRAI